MALKIPFISHLIVEVYNTGTESICLNPAEPLDLAFRTADVKKKRKQRRKKRRVRDQAEYVHKVEETGKGQECTANLWKELGLDENPR